MTTELSCRPSRVSKSSVQLANHAICLCDNREPINQGHVFFFVFHFDLTPSSDGQLSKFQLDPRFSTEKYIKVVKQYRPTNKSVEFAILPAALGSKSSIIHVFLLKKTIN